MTGGTFAPSRTEKSGSPDTGFGGRGRLEKIPADDAQPVRAPLPDSNRKGTASMSTPLDLVVLLEDPAAVGRRLGAIWKDRLPGIVDRFYAAMAVAGLDESFLTCETAAWESRMRNFSPHTLAEMEATGVTASLDAD
jgi:hypothetical protein